MTQLLLTLEELARLQQCETIIEKGLQTFVEVGNALLEIRDSRLYRRDFDTFEDYCRQRWAIRRDYADKLIAAVGVVKNLHTIEWKPTHESQVRPLAKLEPEQQREIWALATAIKPNPTAAQVQQVAETITKAINDARKDSENDINPARIENPEKPNQPFDDRWLQWIGALKQILRIDPFNVDAILDQQSRVGDDEAILRRFQEARTAKWRIEEFLTKLKERFPHVFI